MHKLDLPVIGGVNLMAWMTNFEGVLKVVLLLLSIGFVIARWFYWSKHKDSQDESID